MPKAKLTKRVREFVKDECHKPSSKYGSEPFCSHFLPTVKYAKILAEELGADTEIVEISAWLHDIGSIIYGRKDHHLTGAKVAGEKLREWGCPEEKIRIVEDCIRHHRGSVDGECQTLEEKIIADADAMSNFDNIAGIFKAAFIYEGLGQEEAGKSVREKLKRKWQKLHFDQSKKIIKPKYEAVMLLLKKENDEGSRGSANLDRD